MIADRFTLGDYIRRRRKDKSVSLLAVAKECGIAYTHLSRIEADSTSPRAETVVKIAEALDGDLKLMLELANCLPRVILDRIEARQASEGVTLNRSFPAASGSNTPGRSIDELLKTLDLDDETKRLIRTATEQFVRLSPSRRNAVASLIASFYAEGDDHGP